MKVFLDFDKITFWVDFIGLSVPDILPPDWRSTVARYLDDCWAGLPLRPLPSALPQVDRFDAFAGARPCPLVALPLAGAPFCDPELVVPPSTSFMPAFEYCVTGWLPFSFGRSRPSSFVSLIVVSVPSWPLVAPSWWRVDGGGGTAVC